MHIANRMRVRKLTISADHTAAARVNLTVALPVPYRAPSHNVVPLSG